MSAHTISPRESSDLFIVSFISGTLLLQIDGLKNQGRPARDAGLPSPPSGHHQGRLAV